jgi:hypothetical protein
MKRKMVNAKNILFFLVALALAFVLGANFGGCEKKVAYMSIKDSVNVTTTYKTFVDTVKFEMPAVKRTVSNDKLDTTKFVACSESVRDSFPLSDSLIEAGIVINTRNNQVDNFDFTYKPKFPKYIYRIDSVFIDSTVYKSVPVPKSYAMVSMGPTVSNFALGLRASLKTRDDFTYSYSFSKPYKDNFNIHEVHLGVPIYRSKHKQK